MTAGKECRMALHIDYYASLNSPWTHMGAARIEAMAMANNASLRIYPVDFGTIFPAVRRPAAAETRAAAAGLPADGTARAGATISAFPINIQPKYFPASEQAVGVLRHRVARDAWATSRRSSWRIAC